MASRTDSAAAEHSPSASNAIALINQQRHQILALCAHWQAPHRRSARRPSPSSSWPAGAFRSPLPRVRKPAPSTVMSFVGFFSRAFLAALMNFSTFSSCPWATPPSGSSRLAAVARDLSAWSLVSPSNSAMPLRILSISSKPSIEAWFRGWSMVVASRRRRGGCPGGCGQPRGVRAICSGPCATRSGPRSPQQRVYGRPVARYLATARRLDSRSEAHLADCKALAHEQAGCT